jgi:hypothetical protein
MLVTIRRPHSHDSYLLRLSEWAWVSVRCLAQTSLIWEVAHQYQPSFWNGRLECLCEERDV